MNWTEATALVATTSVCKICEWSFICHQHLKLLHFFLKLGSFGLLPTAPIARCGTIECSLWICVVASMLVLSRNPHSFTSYVILTNTHCCNVSYSVHRWSLRIGGWGSCVCARVCVCVHASEISFASFVNFTIDIGTRVNNVLYILHIMNQKFKQSLWFGRVVLSRENATPV